MSIARPIIFSAPMVRATLAGQKSQTRRIVKPQPVFNKQDQLTDPYWLNQPFDGLVLPMRTDMHVHCPFGQPGDQLWVRESHYLTDNGYLEYAVYAADSNDVREHLQSIDRLPPDFPSDVKARHRKLRPSIHMPRWASRITLEVADVRVERLQDISDADCWAEGIAAVRGEFDEGKTLYAQLWESIHGSGSWNMNPWVWVIEFQAFNGVAS